jgi:hypothetical protein
MHTLFELPLLIGASTLPFAAHAQRKPASPAAPPAPSKVPAAQPTTDDDETGDIVVTGRALQRSVISDIEPEHQLTPGHVASCGVGTISELLDQVALSPAAHRPTARRTSWSMAAACPASTRSPTCRPNPCCASTSCAGSGANYSDLNHPALRVRT